MLTLGPQIKVSRNLATDRVCNVGRGDGEERAHGVGDGAGLAPDHRRHHLHRELEDGVRGDADEEAAQHREEDEGCGKKVRPIKLCTTTSTSNVRDRS